VHRVKQSKPTTMGINGLWDVIGKGELVKLAQYSTDHFNQHGRPLRVAVDEPGW
jgi:Holliday junction resolvase YEN1